MKVSVVIPNFNGKEFLKKNLPAVIKACQKWNKIGWEIIVADDASIDDSAVFLKNNYSEVKVVRHQKNQRFAAVCNTGVRKAKGGIVVLLNNDVSPEEGFLEPLLANFEDRRVFAVGCKEKDMVNGKAVYSGRGIMKFKRGLAVHWRARSQDENTTSWVTAGSGAYDRKKWLEIGGMDTLFRPAYEEDRDISYRAVKHGWKILFEPKSMVAHSHESTNIKVFGKRKIQIVSFKNQFLFVWKNITDWQYLAWHFFWLPYHLTVTCLRSRGLLFIGFLSACCQLSEVLRSRKQVKELYLLEDKDII